MRLVWFDYEQTYQMILVTHESILDCRICDPQRSQVIGHTIYQIPGCV